MKIYPASRLLLTLVASLAACLFATSAFADSGVIVFMTRKCFVINILSGYVIVDGWVSASKGDTVIGDFNTYGSTKIFDASGNNISGYIYIEEWGLSKSRLQDKWKDKYAEKCN